MITQMKSGLLMMPKFGATNITLVSIVGSF